MSCSTGHAEAGVLYYSCGLYMTIFSARTAEYHHWLFAHKPQVCTTPAAEVWRTYAETFIHRRTTSRTAVNIIDCRGTLTLSTRLSTPERHHIVRGRVSCFLSLDWHPDF